MSSSEPCVTVIVLTFNSAPYIARCLNSLRAQTLADFEAIVVDAGSTDGTYEVVRRYDRRFRWLELAGSDMGMARNHGAAAARGRYLCFLDSDDLYLPEKLEAQVAALERSPQDEAHFCRAYHFRTGRPDRVGLPPVRAPRAELGWFLAGNNENLNTLCLRHSTWMAGYRFGEGDRGRYGEEWRHQLAMALGGVPMVRDPRPLAVVELRPDSHTTWDRQWVMKRQAIAELERIAPRLAPAAARKGEITAAIEAFRTKLVFALLLAGRFDEAAREVVLLPSGVGAAGLAGMVAFFRRCPATWSRALVRRLWLARQDRLFAWAPALEGVRQAIADVAPPKGER